MRLSWERIGTATVIWFAIGFAGVPLLGLLLHHFWGGAGFIVAFLIFAGPIALAGVGLLVAAAIEGWRWLGRRANP